MTTAIVGSRAKFWGNQAEFVIAYIDGLLDNWPDDEMVISGHSPGGGVDIWVEDACDRLGVPFTPYPPDSYSPPAFFARNEKMAVAAHNVLAICSAATGLTPGTRDMVDRALRHKRHLEVLFI